MNIEQAGLLLDQANNVLKEGKILYQIAIDALKKDDPDFFKIEKTLKDLRPGLDDLINYMRSRINEIEDNTYHVTITNKEGKVVDRLEIEQSVIDARIMPRIKDPTDTEYHSMTLRRLGG